MGGGFRGWGVSGVGEDLTAPAFLQRSTVDPDSEHWQIKTVSSTLKHSIQKYLKH